MTHRFSGHDPGEGDTAGVPWKGRTLTGTGFDHDDGEADPQLAALLAQPGGRDDGAVVAAVAAARLIVPIVAVAGEVDESSGMPVEVSSDMAAVTLVAPDGQRALPAFTSTAALAAWDEAARPVPVTARRAALAAVQEGCEVIPLDIGGGPAAAAYTLRPSMVWALAMGRDWMPAHQDGLVTAAVAAAVAGQPEITGHALSGTADGALEVTMHLRPGLTQQELQQLLARVGELIAADPEARSRVDAVRFRVLADRP